MIALRLAVLLLGAGLAGAGPAMADDIVVNATIIDRARAEGLIGERYDGYMAVVSASAGDEVRRQVGKANIRRRVLYGDVALKRGVTRHDVGSAAGCQILSRLSAGDYYMLDDERWRRLGPGETAPRPDYCG